MNNPLAKAILVCCCTLLLLTACKQDADAGESVTLTIAGVIPDLFRMEYGQQMEINGKTLQLELVPYEELPRTGDLPEQVEQIYNAHSPDIVFFSGAHNLPGLIEAGYLLALDHYMKDQQEDTASIAAIVMDKLRAAGDGQIYAWPTTFSTEALFYNRALFDRYNVPYPSEQLSWPELLSLVKQLSNREPEGQESFYPLLAPGFNEPDEKVFRLIYNAGRAEGLQIVHPATLNVTADSDSWRALWSLFIDAFREGVISNEAYAEPEEDSAVSGITFEEKYRLFLEGKAAMAQGDPSLLYMLAGQDELPWGISRQPGSEQLYLQVTDMYGINPNSAHKDEAWALLSYLNSEESVKKKTGIRAGQVGAYIASLPVRASVMEQALSQDLSPFYDQRPASVGVYEEVGFPPQVYETVKEQMMLQIAAVLREERTIDQAVEELQAVLETSAGGWSDAK